MSKDWRELSEAASREQDPKKLLELVTQLNEALARRDRDSNAPQESLNPADDEKDCSVNIRKFEKTGYSLPATFHDAAFELAC